MAKKLMEGQLRVAQLKEIQKQVRPLAERLGHTQTHAQWAIFAKLDRLQTLRQNQEEEEVLPHWDRVKLVELEKQESQLGEQAAQARANLRELKERLELLLEPVWQHIAASPYPKWARYGEIRPKALRGVHAHLLVELAIFVCEPEDVHLANELVKWVIGDKYLNSYGISASSLRSLRRKSEQHRVNLALQISRLGFPGAREQILELENTRRCREQLCRAGVPVGVVEQYQIRLLAPSDLPALGKWMGNCIGRRSMYSERVRRGRAAILAAYARSGELNGLPVAVLEVHPCWAGLSSGERAGRYLRGYHEDNPGQLALKRFIERKSAASRVQRAAQSHMALA